MTAYDGSKKEKGREEGRRERDDTLIDICTIDTQLAAGFQEEVLPTWELPSEAN